MTLYTKDIAKQIYDSMQVEFFRMGCSLNTYKFYLTFKNTSEIDIKHLTLNISFSFKGMPVHNEQVVLSDFTRTNEVSHTFLLEGKFDQTHLDSFEIVY